jgi:hypothetical protein
MSLYKPGRESDAPPSEKMIAAVGQLTEEFAKAGVLIATDGLQPSSKGARVRISNGKLTVTDGPFAETKELIGGYAILNAKSKEEAIELTKRFLSVMGEGECEIRQMQDEPGFEAGHSQPAEATAAR